MGCANVRTLGFSDSVEDEVRFRIQRVVCADGIPFDTMALTVVGSTIGLARNGHHYRDRPDCLIAIRHDERDVKALVGIAELLFLEFHRRRAHISAGCLCRAVEIKAVFTVLRIIERHVIALDCVRGTIKITLVVMSDNCYRHRARVNRKLTGLERHRVVALISLARNRNLVFAYILTFFARWSLISDSVLAHETLNLNFKLRVFVIIFLARVFRRHGDRSRRHFKSPGNVANRILTCHVNALGVHDSSIIWLDGY